MIRVSIFLGRIGTVEPFFFVRESISVSIDRLRHGSRKIRKRSLLGSKYLIQERISSLTIIQKYTICLKREFRKDIYLKFKCINLTRADYGVSNWKSRSENFIHSQFSR